MDTSGVFRNQHVEIKSPSWGYNMVQLEASSLAPRPGQVVVVMARLQQGGMDVAGAAAAVGRRQ